MLTYSISELIDKIAVIHLKVYHLEEEIGIAQKENRDVTEIEKLCDQVVTLNTLRMKIVDSMEEFFNVANG